MLMKRVTAAITKNTAISAPSMRQSYGASGTGFSKESDTRGDSSSPDTSAVAVLAFFASFFTIVSRMKFFLIRTTASNENFRKFDRKIS
jgi:hypothetical protein